MTRLRSPRTGAWKRRKTIPSLSILVGATTPPIRSDRSVDEGTPTERETSDTGDHVLCAKLTEAARQQVLGYAGLPQDDEAMRDRIRHRAEELVVWVASMVCEEHTDQITRELADPAWSCVDSAGISGWLLTDARKPATYPPQDQ